MRVSYDPAAYAACLHLVERSTGASEIARTEEVTAGVMLDFDGQNRVVGIEFLSVSKLPGASPLQMTFEVLTSDDAAA